MAVYDLTVSRYIHARGNKIGVLGIGILVFKDFVKETGVVPEFTKTLYMTNIRKTAPLSLNEIVSLSDNYEDDERLALSSVLLFNTEGALLGVYDYDSDKRCLFLSMQYVEDSTEHALN